MDQRAYVEVRADRDEPVIALIGEFDSASAGELQQQFCNLRAANYRHVVLDLSETRLIDARTLGVMARAYRDGLDITVHGADGIALKALEVAGLATLFHTGVRRRSAERAAAMIHPRSGGTTRPQAIPTRHTR